MDAMNRFLGFSLDQLTMFVAVVDSGSFAGASRDVGRVQSAVSNAVGNLERSLGTPLFERSGRRSVITEAGKRLAAEARLVLAQAREIEECASSLRAGIEATVSLAVDTVFPRPVLFAACRRFQKRFPSVPLRLYEETLSRALVEEGRVDFGICNLAGTTSDSLVTRLCRTVQLVPVCSNDHVLAAIPPPQPEQVLRSAVQIVLSERAVPKHSDLGVLAARTWRVTDLDTKLGLLRAGVGWGSVPLEAVQPELDSGDLVRLHPEPWPDGHEIHLHTVARAGSPMGLAGRWLERTLADQSVTARSSS